MVEVVDARELGRLPFLVCLVAPPDSLFSFMQLGKVSLVCVVQALTSYSRSPQSIRFSQKSSLSLVCSGPFILHGA